MKTKQAVDYTSREFQTIRNDLLNYVKKFYPDSYKDFNEASFGSLVLDLVAYVGDNLSFYTDFNFNEGNLDTALKFENVVKLAKSKGYQYNPAYSSYGTLSFFLLVPVMNNSVAPDEAYMPILRRGSRFSSASNKIFSLIEDVNFADPSNLAVVGQVDSTTGAPTTYAIKAFGKVISGELAIHQETITTYQKFRRIKIPGSNITEIVSVFDSNGNNWYEVENLAQNTIYIPIINRNSDKYTVPNLMKPVQVARRYVVERELDGVYVRFGCGSDEQLPALIDPSKLVLSVHGKEYVTETCFDPSRLIETDKMGVAPTNVTMTFRYRINTSDDVNAGVGTVRGVANPIFQFVNPQTLSNATMATVSKSLEVTNEEVISGDVTTLTIDEIKHRAMGSMAAQNRAVTKEDYIALVYKMPPNFGAIKRVNIVQDRDSVNQRNLNMYVVSEVTSNNQVTLTQTTDSIKENIKTWVSSRKMINDTLDILDAKICNFGVRFRAVSFPNTNKYVTYLDAINVLKDLYKINKDIGEPIVISDIYSALKTVPNILDVDKVEITQQFGTLYSDAPFNIEELMSADRKVVYCPFDTIFELKYPDSDIVGEIV